MLRQVLVCWWVVTTGVFAAEPETPRVITAAMVRPHVEFLADPALRGRSGRDARKAADYIVERFRELKLQPLFPQESFYQPIPGKGEPDQPPPLLGTNVGAWLEGSDPARKDEFIVIGVHHDHLGTQNGEIYAGADDNASGVAMLLEVARQYATAKERPARSIAFIGFDLEEHLLWGSRWFVAHPPWPMERVKLFITADMIGRSLGDLPLPVVFVMGSEHSPEVRAALEGTKPPVTLEIARMGIDHVGTRSDYGPFRDRQIPFLFFSTGQHPDYHTPRDTPSKINYDRIADVSTVVLSLTRTVANAVSTPQWLDVPELGLDEPKALERITTLLLDDNSERLTDLQRYLVSTVRHRCRKILAAGTMTPDDRTWLARMSQVMLLSVF
jgi:hypothetical protein